MWRNLVRCRHAMTIFNIIFLKTVGHFFTILSLHKIYNNSFQMSLGSQLAGLVCQTGVHLNIAKGKQVIWRYLIRNGYDTTFFDVIFFSKRLVMFS